MPDVFDRDNKIRPTHQWFIWFDDLRDGVMTNLWNDLWRMSMKPSHLRASVADRKGADFFLKSIRSTPMMQNCVKFSA
jgi:hypothetical protein